MSTLREVNPRIPEGWAAKLASGEFDARRYAVWANRTFADRRTAQRVMASVNWPRGRPVRNDLG